MELERESNKISFILKSAKIRVNPSPSANILSKCIKIPESYP